MKKILYFGKLMKLEYETKSDVFVPAEGEDGRYEISADALQYTYHKEEAVACKNGSSWYLYSGILVKVENNYIVIIM